MKVFIAAVFVLLKEITMLELMGKQKLVIKKFNSIISNSPRRRFILMTILVLLLSNIAFDLGDYIGKFLYVLLH